MAQMLFSLCYINFVVTDKGSEDKDKALAGDAPTKGPKLARAKSNLDVDASKQLLEQSLHVLFDELRLADECYRTIPALDWWDVVKKREEEKQAAEGTLKYSNILHLEVIQLS